MTTTEVQGECIRIHVETDRHDDRFQYDIGLHSGCLHYGWKLREKDMEEPNIGTE